MDNEVFKGVCNELLDVAIAVGTQLYIGKDEQHPPMLTAITTEKDPLMTMELPDMGSDLGKKMAMFIFDKITQRDEVAIAFICVETWFLSGKGEKEPAPLYGSLENHPDAGEAMVYQFRSKWGGHVLCMCRIDRENKKIIKGDLHDMTKGDVTLKPWTRVPTGNPGAVH